MCITQVARRGFATLSVLVASLAALGSDVPPNAYSGLRWRLVRPFRAGWSTCAEGIPARPDTFYFGAADGGVWKTTDAGRTWKPLFDHEPVGSIGPQGNIGRAGSCSAPMKQPAAGRFNAFRCRLVTYLG